MDLDTLKKLAGINEFSGYTEYNPGSVASNKRHTEATQNIRPGTEEWFGLWFGNSGNQTNMPGGFRGRKK